MIEERPALCPGGPPERRLLATNDLDMEADLVILAYRHRWKIELVFRRLKCIDGCRRSLFRFSTEQP